MKKKNIQTLPKYSSQEREDNCTQHSSSCNVPKNTDTLEIPLRSTAVACNINILALVSLALHCSLEIYIFITG